MIHQNQHKNTLSIYFIDLTASAINAQTIAVRRNYGQTAKFWDSYSPYDGTTVTLRRFFFVCIMRKRLYAGYARNTRRCEPKQARLSHKQLRVPGNFAQILELMRLKK